MDLGERFDYNESRPPEICSYVELVRIKFSDIVVALSVIMLIVINVMVIAGNILVILAVFVSSKLRTSTNYFIVSLAVADLLVGVTVLPYSLANEVLGAWVFGEVWCQGWLVTDVWLCTASILNLCAISVDRYLAVTRPVRYRSMITSRRAKMVIAGIWALSFLICFPPLVGWNGSHTSFLSSASSQKASGGVTTTSASVELPAASVLASMASGLTSRLTSHSSFKYNLDLSNLSGGHMSASTAGLRYSYVKADHLELSSPSGLASRNASSALSQPGCLAADTQCALFNDKGYVIYSALGSFYIPMLFMFFFYWRIYLVASRTTRALKRGYKTTKSSKSSQSTGTGSGSPEEQLTLRIHRGYMCDNSEGRHHEPRSPRPSTMCKPTIVESHCADLEGTELKHFHPHNHLGSGHEPGTPQRSPQPSAKRKLPITLYRSSRLSAQMAQEAAASSSDLHNGLQALQMSGGQRGDHNKLSPTPSIASNMYAASPSSPCSSREGSARGARLASNRFSRRQNNSHTGKWQAKRFHAETKAAKTVGIIVGGFIICWFPFFTAYLIRAFCDEGHCIPELLMSVFTWLGYCNSAINPVIYGMFSRDFRRAFKNIICRCTCKEEVGVSLLIRQIHLPTFFEEDMQDDVVKSNEEYK